MRILGNSTRYVLAKIQAQNCKKKTEFFYYFKTETSLLGLKVLLTMHLDLSNTWTTEE